MKKGKGFLVWLAVSARHLFSYDIQDSQDAPKILIINIFQEFDLFCRFSCWHTHDWWEDEMQKMKSYLALSGCPPRAPCQESFILSETCSPQIGRKTLDRQTQGQLPWLVCYWRSAIVETFKLSPSCLNFYLSNADADVILILMSMLILILVLQIDADISMLMNLFMINNF